MLKSNVLFKTPVLFIIFNRPDVTQIVFDQIKKIKPKYLFVAADGPRVNNIDDLAKCEKTRAIINQIDWDCELKTLFRDKNLGCGLGVSSAITWFFDNVEQGIILEDDCVPDLTFFDFAELMLEKYKYNNKVKMISGTNYLFNKIKRTESYYFSKYYSIWGWATWKRAWRDFDFNLTNWPEIKNSNYLKNSFNFKRDKLTKFWSNNFDAVYDKKIDCWGYQWFYACLLSDGVTLVPVNNLVSNIGNIGAHGSGGSPFLRMPIKKTDIQLIIDPKNIVADDALDKLTYKNIGLFKYNLFKKIWRFRFAVFKTIKKMVFIQK
ncbi:MAG: Nucleotide-diphospho-sugar transferase domain-containing protein [candidate division TM6 bacterium GW2011_GWF2_28_16]|nr:MAG: Nucleotide-diphospho-sugar transferase domain-containing protein [candidate division TM6 bacterium GW2011_GWF2_28_16]